jgi:hypothetical protein
MTVDHMESSKTIIRSREHEINILYRSSILGLGIIVVQNIIHMAYYLFNNYISKSKPSQTKLCINLTLYNYKYLCKMFLA